MTASEAFFYQQENGRWEWLEPKGSNFLGPVDGSICTFASAAEAANDRQQHVAAPFDMFGRRIRTKDALLKLLRIAAACEIDCDGSMLNVVWHPRDANGNNWYVQTDECIDAIWDIVTLLQATYSIPDEG